MSFFRFVISIASAMRLPALAMAFLIVLAAGMTARADGVSAPVPVGVLLNDAAANERLINALELAVAEINGIGGNQNSPVALVFMDTRMNSDVAVRMVNRLARKEEAVLIISAQSGAIAYDSALTANRIDVPFIAFGPGDSRITEQKWRNIYRVSPPLEVLTETLADFLFSKIRPKAVRILQEDSFLGDVQAEKMTQLCRQNATRVSARVRYTRKDLEAESLNAIWDPLSGAPSELIYICGDPKRSMRLANRIKQAGAVSPVCSDGWLQMFEGRMMQNGTSEGVVFSSVWFSQETRALFQTFQSRYFNRYGIRPDFYEAAAYATVLVAKGALDAAGSHRPESIRSALNKIRRNTPLGTIGFADYGNHHRQNRFQTAVYQIIHGKAECIWPDALSTAALTLPQ